MRENDITKIIVDLCLKIHKALDPGLLGSVYEEVLVHELKKSKLSVARQVGIPAMFEMIKLDIGFRVDVIVEI